MTQYINLKKTEQLYESRTGLGDMEYREHLEGTERETQRW